MDMRVMLVLNWGFLAISVGVLGVGMVLTRGRVRVLLGVALGCFLAQLVLGRLGGADWTPAGMVAVAVLQGLLAIAQTGAFVAAAVVGAREVAASRNELAALTSEPAQDWTQPVDSPDPKLLAD